mgnify:CR=1 FL=1
MSALPGIIILLLVTGWALRWDDAIIAWWRNRGRS